ncbi:glycoside hydrolase family 38 C-terminal domain-containing protein [soil metagenome]
MKKKAAQRNVHYVLSTHWDREWHQTFQNFRYRLVRLMDRVIDGLENGELRGPFQTDGQTIILDDYLEIRPERRGAVERLAREGKLIIGPWFVLPDEFLVSGEAHIRNIRLGREIAREYGGEPSKAGWVCDLFGHISQMPQIFAGFGIDTAFLWRGVNLHGKRHLLWTGADGTEILCYKFDHFGYCDYAFKVRQAHKPDAHFDAARTHEDLDAYIASEAAETETDAILLFDGGDHQEWDRQVYGVLAEKFDAGGTLRIQHSSLESYIDEIRNHKNRVTTRVSGELREPGRVAHKMAHQIHGVLCSRVWIKQWNAACQNLLCQWAEPIGAMANAALSIEYPRAYLDVAWRWLLENHPHDSICGCSIDQVHEDMKYRFAQCEQIAERLTLEATRHIAASIKGDIADDELRLTIFNPLPIAINRTTEVELQIPMEWPTFGEFFNFEAKPAFTIGDARGNDVPYQRIAQSPNRRATRLFETKFPHGYMVNKVRVSIQIVIPPMGYTTFTVKKGTAGTPTRHPAVPALATSECSMENAHLSVRIEPNGTLTITDKRSGQTYSNVLTFEERADIGDGWFHGVATNDQILPSTASQSDIAMLENGPFVTAFRIRTTMRVPAEFDFRQMIRSESRVEMVIDSVVRLRKEADYLEIETTIQNNARDHRVRVLMPSGAKAKTYLSDSPFDVVERPIALRKDNHLYAELEVETKPQQTWTAVFDKKRGLAVLSVGLMETAVRDVPARTLALTLFRGTRRTVETDGEPNGQLLGEMKFRYLIAPLTGEPDRTHLFLLGQQLGAGLRDVQLHAADQAIYREKETLPPEGGWLSISGPAVLASVRRIGDTVEARLFNPLESSIKSTISQHSHMLTNAAFVDFESNVIAGPLKVKSGAVQLKLKAKEIVTVRFS